MTQKIRTSRKDAPSRREEIVRWLKTEGTLSYAQIQQRFKVAPMTSRRDIAALDATGQAVKTLRGAMRITSDVLLSEGHLRDRVGKNLPAKRAIARAAAGLIKPGSGTLHLDGGTTCIELARIVARSSITQSLW